IEVCAFDRHPQTPSRAFPVSAPAKRKMEGGKGCHSRTLIIPVFGDCAPKKRAHKQNRCPIRCCDGKCCWLPRVTREWHCAPKSAWPRNNPGAAKFRMTGRPLNSSCIFLARFPSKAEYSFCRFEPTPQGGVGKAGVRKRPPRRSTEKN